MHPAMERTTIAPFMRGNMGIPALTGFGSLAGGGAGGQTSGGQQTSMGSPSSLQQTSHQQIRPSQRSHVGESGCERPRILSVPSAVMHHPSPLGIGQRHMASAQRSSQPDLNPRPCFVSSLSTATPGMCAAPSGAVSIAETSRWTALRVFGSSAQAVWSKRRAMARGRLRPTVECEMRTDEI